MVTDFPLGYRSLNINPDDAIRDLYAPKTNVIEPQIQFNVPEWIK